MFLEVVHSEGLAHLSYILGDQGKAAVIDPRRDCGIYLDIAYRQGAQITHIFETHRNEDYVIGSTELANRTGAEIYHGAEFPFQYGNAVQENDVFELGDLALTILSTPGHTYESISIILADKSFSQDAVAVFTGDALFIGDVGRTDFFPDKREEVAGLLYDSLFEKILPLGDQVILYPAHGAGSVCGSGMAEREFSTVGYERRNNPRLQLTDREQFIQFKVNEHHYQPPYFRLMEHYNAEGAPVFGRLPRPKPFAVDPFAQAMAAGMIVLDTRTPEAFAGAYIPGSLAIPLSMIPAYAGWFLPYDKPIGLVVDRYEDLETAVRYLVRIGYDDVRAYLDGGLHAWATQGRKYDSIPAVYAGDLKRSLETEENNFILLDVRKQDEVAEGKLSGAKHIYLGELPQRLDEIPKDRPITTFCGSGQRAIIAASILKQHGYTDVADCLGSMAACQAIGCPMVTD
ncbi:MAG: MBL fold metallo-hydrolase [Gammaproteobacteria bacterium]|jgi:hydroxyacylglutathione hydrolase